MLQLYRVNIFLQPPDAVQPPTSKPPYFVLRRYSQFNNLHKEVRAALVPATPLMLAGSTPARPGTHPSAPHPLPPRPPPLPFCSSSCSSQSSCASAACSRRRG
jgi:hypothetical protein